MASQRYAIVGHSCRFPGGADSPSAFWSLLEAGAQATQEIPKRCFDLQDVYTESQERGRDFRRMGVRTAAVIDDAEYFDAAFFGISQREARVMDPQQRKLLEVAHEAVEASGYSNTSKSASNAPETFGVYVAAATDDYIANLETQEVDVFYSPSTLRAFMAGRISHHFGWSGPSIVVDTACSSSLVALHTACRAIQTGDCRAALVAGVNLIASPLTMLGLWRGHFLSPDGRCKTFDASADGYGRAEGVAAFVVKKLEDAIHDQDHIEALICGTALNQSGLAVSITHPHVQTQHDLFQKLHNETGISPQQVGYVEMHGTGTKAGDRCEMASVTSVYGSSTRCSSNLGTARSVPLVVGSVKANVGHAEAAAGFAGLCKLLGMLKHSKIPPQVSLKTLNPELRALVETQKVQIPTRSINWQQPPNGAPRVALLNSFGAAGSNASALVMEHIPAPLSTARLSGETSATSLFCLSARTSHGMHKLIRSYMDWIQDQPSSQDSNLGVRLCYSVCARRIHHPYYRLAFSVPDANVNVIQHELRSAAASFESGQELKRIGKEPAPVIGVLCSHTSPKQIRETLDADTLFKRCWDEMIQALPVLHQKLISQLLLSDNLREHDQDTVSFLNKVAMLKSWKAWSVRDLRVAVTGPQIQVALKVTANSLTLQRALEQIRLGSHDLPIELSRAAIYKLQTGQLDSKPQSSKPKSIVVLTETTSGLMDRTETQESLETYIEKLPPKSFTEILATLYSHGAQIDFGHVLALNGRQAAPLSVLPLHSFAKDHYWFPYETRMVKSLAKSTDDPTGSCHHRATGTLDSARKRYEVQECRIQSVPEKNIAAYVLPVQEVKDEILGHKVAGIGMCPASVYNEMMLASSIKHLGGSGVAMAVFQVDEIQYSAPLRYDEAAPGLLICQLQRDLGMHSQGDNVYLATVLSSVSDSDHKTEVVKHAVARITLKPSEEPLKLDVIRITQAAQCSVSTEQKELYATFAARVVEYSQLYQTIATLHTDTSVTNGEALLTRPAVQLIQEQMSTGEYVLSPILQDTLLHTCGYMAHTSPQYRNDVVFIAQRVGRVRYAATDEAIDKIAVELQWDTKTSSFVGKAQAVTLDGHVVVSIDGIVFKRLSKRSFFSILKGGPAAPLSTTMAVETAVEQSLPDQKLSSASATRPCKEKADISAKLLAKIIETISVATGIEKPSIKSESTLEELGVDSLLFIELLSHLNKSVGHEFAVKLEEVGNEPGLAISDLVKLVGPAYAFIDSRDSGSDPVQAPLSPRLQEESQSAVDVTTVNAAKQGNVTIAKDNEFVKSQSIEALAHILGMATDELSSHQNATLEELGLDSLGILELVQALRTHVDAKQLDVHSISNYITVKEYIATIRAWSSEEPISVTQTDTQLPATTSAGGTVPRLSEGPILSVEEIKLANTLEQDRLEVGAVNAAQTANWHNISSVDAQFLRKALRMEQNPARIRVGKDPGAAPVFLCADGSGIGTTSCSLPADQSRDIWILHHERMWDLTACTFGVVEHASMLVDRIESVYPKGDLIMAGWSFGGVLAWEVAYQLRKRHSSERVLGTVAIDSPCPLEHVPLDANIIDSLMHPPRSAPTSLANDGQKDKLEYLSDLTRQLIKASFLRSGSAMVDYAHRARVDPNTALGSILTVNKSGNVGNTPLDLCLLRSRDSYWTPKLGVNDDGRYDWLLKRSCYGFEKSQQNATLGWSRVGRVAKCSEIAGNHFTPFATRNVTSLSDELETACLFLTGP